MTTTPLRDWQPIPAFELPLPAPGRGPTQAAIQTPSVPTWEALDRKDWHVWIMPFSTSLSPGSHNLNP